MRESSKQMTIDDMVRQQNLRVAEARDKSPLEVAAFSD
jgi:hypothetical protein